MNKFLPALVLAAVAMPFQTALANDFEYPYVGVGGGVAEMSDLCDDLSNCDDDANFYRIYSGARLLPHFGSEVGYNHAREFGISGYRIRPKAIDITGNFYLPMGQSFDLFAKAGAYLWRTRVDADQTTLEDNNVDNAETLATRDGTEHGIDFKTGVGLRVGLTDLVSIRGDYTFIPNFGNSDIGGTQDLHKVSGSLQLHF